MNLRCLLIPVFACAFMSNLAYAEDAFFDSNGLKIRYVTEGAGEPVVLIHGWMGDSSMWGRDGYGKTKLTAVAGYQLVALDCRGHGQSEKPHETDRYGAEMAADVVRLLDHLKIPKAHLVGYSMGAFVAGKVAASHPDRVLSLVYGGQAPLLIGESGSREIDVVANAVDEGKDLGAYIIEVSPADKPKPTMAQANVLANLMFAGKDVKALAAAGRSFKGLEVAAEDLKKCEAPCLYVYGSKEGDRLKKRVAEQRQALSRSELKVIEGGTHMTTLTNPEFGAAIAAFLRAHRRP